MPSSIFSEWNDEIVKTAYGNTAIKTDGAHVFIQRHGNPPVPPHRINHRANIETLRKMGAKKLVSINSVGSLKKEIRPGTFIIPDDFISFQDVPTFFDNEMRFTIPSMDKEFSGFLFKLCRNLKMNVIPKGVYIQTRGPRLETKAEIRFLCWYGDVIGMTMASEATLCIELGMPYVSICSVDNYCNGIVEVPLTMEEIQKNCLENLNRLESLIEKIINNEDAEETTGPH